MIQEIKGAVDEARVAIRHFYCVIIPWRIKFMLLIIAIRFERLADKIRAEK